MSGKWPRERQQELIELRESGASLEEVAQQAGVSRETARYHLNGIIPLGKMVNALRTYPHELVQIRGDCALTSDWHAPYFSMKWLKRLLAVCRKLEVYQLAIVGDLTDFKWLSHYVKTQDSLREELTVVTSLIRLLLSSFDRVYWSRGNHEERLLRVLDGQDILPLLAELMAKGEAGELKLTDAPTMLLDDNWRLEHPKTYSRDATKVATAVAAIFHKNVASAHGHFIGYKHDVSGEYIGLDLGGMFDIEKQEYLYLGGVTTHPRWNPGFWIYRDGRPRPFDNALINWDEWGINGNPI